MKTVPMKKSDNKENEEHTAVLHMAQCWEIVKDTFGADALPEHVIQLLDLFDEDDKEFAEELAEARDLAKEIHGEKFTVDAALHIFDIAVAEDVDFEDLGDEMKMAAAHAIEVFGPVLGREPKVVQFLYEAEFSDSEEEEEEDENEK